MTFLDAKKMRIAYKKCDCLWGLRPNRYVVRIPKIIKGGKILDVGVGEGRNSLFLARNGFKVTGVDISKEAVSKFIKFAKKENLRVKGIISDVVDFRIREKYKAVICVATLHLVPKDKVIQTIRKIQKYTEDNGVNLITVFTKKDIGYEEYPRLYFFNTNELKKLYKGWKIILYKNYIKKETHGKPHKHHICALIAKKK